MSTDTKPRIRKTTVRDRAVYRLTADQVFRMVECGILPEGGNIELWDGVLYKMTRSEIHSVVVVLIARAIRKLLPNGYHEREEKPFKFGEHSLPEPDVAIVRGDLLDFLPNPPTLSHLAVVVEVSLTSASEDIGKRLRRYAEVGIPFYWIADVARGSVSIHSRPQTAGKTSIYSSRETFLPGESFPVVIDGTEVGRIAVDDLFPPASKG